jgi:primosomal protein N' (replication factor Y)
MSQILKVAIPKPIRGIFDYLPPKDASISPDLVGVRILVPFGRSTCVGYLLRVTDESDVAGERLKRAIAFLDEAPLLGRADLDFLLWTACYYHHPVGESITAGFPQILRQAGSSVREKIKRFGVTEEGRFAMAQGAVKARRQAQVLALLEKRGSGCTEQDLSELDWDWRRPLKALIEKSWISVESEALNRVVPKFAKTREQPKPLNGEQELAVGEVVAALGVQKTFLLDGVTGSGKTEVYLQVIEQVLAQGKQALVLLPEISLTPQLESRFRSRFQAPVVVFHSDMTESSRRDSWLSMQQQEAAIMLGTRSAVFTPMRSPGLIVIDEEHDTSFKQQEGFRYSARDIAVMRAARLEIPIILGSATPSLESLANVRRKRYRHLRLKQRAGNALPPRFKILDIRGKKLNAGLSEALVELTRTTLARGEQALLFLNRRGFAPSLICHGCGWVANCGRCDTHLVVHAKERLLRCHHCGYERPEVVGCLSCGSDDLRPTGLGTERVEKSLARLFPEARISRIDRDSTRRRGSLERALTEVQEGRTDILLGTQMLAKGHHFPGVTLVGIIDVDAGLYSPDFRASERTAQLIMQVAGRAGRESRAGIVALQTRHPAHPLLEKLIVGGYCAFAEAALAERKDAGLPPFSHHVLWRSESNDKSRPQEFLVEIAACVRGASGIDVFGPVAAPLERKAGRFRFQLLLQCAERKTLHEWVGRLIAFAESKPESKRVRWSVDVDPIDFS